MGSIVMLAGLFAGLPSAAPPGPPPAQPVAPIMVSSDSANDRETEETVFVELVVNGHANGTIAEMRVSSGGLWMDTAALREAGIAVSGGTAIDLSRRPGFVARYDAPAQRLYLDVPAGLLPVSRIAAGSRAQDPLLSDAGAVLNYDAFVQHGNRRMSVALGSEQRVFTGLFALSNHGVARIGSGAGDGYVRFDTQLVATDADRALDLVVGDLVSHPLRWTGSVRLGGIGIARNFRLRPDLVTVPLPSFAGQVAVASAVDLFVNGYRQAQVDVAPGRFVLDQVPVVTGAGEARIVTTDAVGRQVETVIPFYVAPDLLRPGFVDFAGEIGLVRRRFGLASFDYGRLAGSATMRRGLTPHLTLEAHGEAAASVAAGGLGAVWAPGRWGAVQGSLSFSRHRGRTGRQFTMGYAYSGRHFGLGVEHVERSGRYAELGTLYRRSTGGSRGDRVSASVILSGIGSLGLGYLDSPAFDGVRARIASASFSAPLGRGISAFAAADHDRGSGATSVQVRIVVPLGARGSAAADLARLPGGRLRASAGVSRGMASHGGFAFAADAAIDDRGDASGQASTIWRGDAIQAGLGAARTPSGSAVWASATGSLALMDGQVFAANALPDAFALVSTGMAGVPVSYENQIVGRTGAGGRLFVPRISAWHAGRFAIDVLDLPAGAVPTIVETRAAVRGGRGALVRLPVTTMRSVILRLTDAAGVPLAPGTLATGPDGETAIVGWDGIVVVERADAAIVLDVDTKGGRCSARATVPADAEPYADLGAVPCV